MLLNDYELTIRDIDEIPIVVDDSIDVGITVSDVLVSEVVLDQEILYSVLVDVDNLGGSVIVGPVTRYGNVTRPFVLNRIISGRGLRYGVVNRPFTMSIATAGNEAFLNDFYGEGLYGEGPYGDTLQSPTYYGAISLPLMLDRSFAGRLANKITSVAQISLATHGMPVTQNNHSIKIRARAVTGSGAVIKAALYQGTTNISGDLTSNVLTNSLVDYALAISDVAADTITDYSDLSIKLWGYDTNGTGLVFEVARLYLELPSNVISSTTHYGVVSRSTTFSKAVAGNRPNKATSVAQISLASHTTPSQRNNHSIKIRARTTTGSGAVFKAALYELGSNRSGDLTSNVLTNTLGDYTLVISDAAAATITNYSDLSIKLWGYDTNGTGLVFEVARAYLELPSA